MISPVIQANLAQTAAEVGATFGFNEQLFVSQCISFAVVSFLLWKFAYKPILQVLEERKKKIADGLENAAKVKQQLADAEARHAEILSEANTQAQKIIEEARVSAQSLASKQQQQAISDAEAIIAKASAATKLERDQEFAKLRSEVARLIVDTTAKVTGKALTPEDQRRLSEEAAREVAAA